MGWYMIFYNFNLLYVWYTFGICSVYQNDQKNWWWLNMFDQILMILVYVQYTKTKLVYGPVNSFFCHINGIFNTRGYEKWPFLTGIQLVYGIMVYI